MFPVLVCILSYICLKGSEINKSLTSYKGQGDGGLGVGGEIWSFWFLRLFTLEVVNN